MVEMTRASQLTDSSRDLMFDRWYSNRLADRPCHFATMNAIGAVSFDQVHSTPCLNNERHHSMHAHAATMAVAVGATAIVHLDEHPIAEYFHCWCCCCCCYVLILVVRLCHCWAFDSRTMVRAVVVVAIMKYFLWISVRLDCAKICTEKVGWRSSNWSWETLEHSGFSAIFWMGLETLTGSNGVRLGLFSKCWHDNSSVEHGTFYRSSSTNGSFGFPIILPSRLDQQFWRRQSLGISMRWIGYNVVVNRSIAVARSPIVIVHLPRAKRNEKFGLETWNSNNFNLEVEHGVCCTHLYLVLVCLGRIHVSPVQNCMVWLVPTSCRYSGHCCCRNFLGALTTNWPHWKFVVINLAMPNLCTMVSVVGWIAGVRSLYYYCYCCCATFPCSYLHLNPIGYCCPHLSMHVVDTLAPVVPFLPVSLAVVDCDLVNRPMVLGLG